MRSLTIQLPELNVYFCIDLSVDVVADAKDAIAVCMSKPKP
jgi:hypothetical protein